MAWIVALAATALFLPAANADASADCRVLEANATEQFQADTAGADLVWMVDGVPGGAPEIGMISDRGLYTAPANMGAELDVTVTAASASDPSAATHWSVCNRAFDRPGNAYHVAIDGSDAGDGTAQAPWRTIQHAVDHVEPGDTVLVHGGIYNETVTITRSGSAEGGYITLMEAPGENAVIDGAGLVDQPYGRRGLITLSNVGYVRVKDFEIRNYKSDSEFIVIGVLVSGAGERIEIRNNVIHRIEANNLPARGNANGLGIAVYGTEAEPLRNVIVDGNELYGLRTGTGESLTVGGNVEGWQVTNNSVHDNNFIGIDAIGYYHTGTESDRARRGWIAGNTVYNLSTAGNRGLTYIAAAIGIYIDGGRDITVERNLVEGNDGGIWILSEHPGKATSNVIVRDNVVRFNRDAGILVGGYHPTRSGGADNCTIVNNTLFENNTRDAPGIHSGELQIGSNATNIRFQNNILHAGRKGYVITKFSEDRSDSVRIGHNLYFSSAGGDQTRWFWEGRNFYNEGRPGDDFKAFRSVSGDTGSMVADPGFVDPETGDFRLRADSPARDSGFMGPGIGVRDGAVKPRVQAPKVDRGAHEGAE
ncbi:hypothetical protein [Chelativorans sp. AA-79]|uniref:hypothetical protein n=1 Tax=Chelativorans sp. AA-79 TaxID=3028735 RepID=UPI0023F922F1|nr:hypothetical protein [Chelativorans sp. AA-79]WEX11037.1 hypothetical protein PVE73_08955 [Chelativorans sp. AA-79]